MANNQCHICKGLAYTYGTWPQLRVWCELKGGLERRTRCYQRAETCKEICSRAAHTANRKEQALKVSELIRRDLQQSSVVVGYRTSRSSVRGKGIWKEPVEHQTPRVAIPDTV